MVTAATVHWEHERWAEAGGTLEAAAELCATRPAWRANVAHALSMQGAAPHARHDHAMVTRTWRPLPF